MSATRRTDRQRPCSIETVRVRMPLYMRRRIHKRLTRSDCIKGKIGRRLMRERDEHL